jgi:sirohydrochlorin ferrochelatase
MTKGSPGTTTVPTALLLIAHGSREPEANADLHHLAAGLREHGHPHVECSYLELAEPDILTGGVRCVELGATQVTLLPFFLSAGVHVRRDVAAARDELAKHCPDVTFRVAEPLGRHPALIEVVLDRVRSVTPEHPQSPCPNA